MISIVTNSAAGKAIHTPFNPNIADSINAKKMIATKPREIDAANAYFVDSTALNMAVTTAVGVSVLLVIFI